MENNEFVFVVLVCLYFLHFLHVKFYHVLPPTSKNDNKRIPPCVGLNLSSLDNIFCVGATLYPTLCVCLLSVPRVVCTLFRTCTKDWMMPGSDHQLYIGVQTDDRATNLEQKRIPHKLRGFLSATPLSMIILLSHKRRVCGIMSMK